MDVKWPETLPVVPRLPRRPRQRAACAAQLLAVVCILLDVRQWQAPSCVPAPCARRHCLSQLLSSLPASAAVPQRVEERTFADGTLRVPLRYCGGGFCLEFAVDARLYRGVLDTGSPWALVSTCRGEACAQYCRYWGCATVDAGLPTSFPDTTEFFAAGRAEVSWRRGEVRLGDRLLDNVTFGVLQEVESMGGNGGGTFFGLVLEGPRRRQPTFLGQTPFRSLQLDFKPGAESLLLSPGSLSIAPESAVPLVDLRPFGTSVNYYAMDVTSLRVGEEELAGFGRIVAVIDTGTTGLALPEDLYQVYDASRRMQSSQLGFRRASAVQVVLATETGAPVTLALQQGQMEPYDESFDVVTPIPRPEGLSPETAALWSEDNLSDPPGLKVDGRVARLEGSVPATVRGEVAVRPGRSFTVVLRAGKDGACRVAVGLAPNPLAGILGEAVGSCGYASEGLALAGGGSVAAEGPRLKDGDRVECGLMEDGRAFWRVNGHLVGPVELDTKGPVYPAVALAGAEVELLGDWGDFQVPRQAGGRPLIIFLGLGFLLGRRVSLDALGRRAGFSELG